MNKITKDTVAKVARLSGLKFSPKQEEVYANRFAKVLEYIEQLSCLDTNGIEPTSHALDIRLASRDDEVEKFIDTDKILENAPQRDGRFIQVPKVI